MSKIIEIKESTLKGLVEIAVFYQEGGFLEDSDDIVIEEAKKALKETEEDERSE